MGDIKFFRKYILEAKSLNSGEVLATVKLPFTIDFDVDRHDYSGSNISTIRLYNLNPSTRSALRQDLLGGDGGDKVITLQAGYGNNLIEILKGDLKQGFSYREGVNFISELIIYDAGGAFGSAWSNRSWGAQTNQSKIIDDLISDLGPFGVTKGVVSSAFSGPIAIGNSYNGPTCSLLHEITNGNFFIDNMKAHALSEKDALKPVLGKINSDSGLIGTPRREKTVLEFDMLFEPRLFLDQYVELESKTDPTFNGTHRVISVHHKGKISDAVCGDAITSIRAEFGTYNIESGK